MAHEFDIDDEADGDDDGDTMPCPHCFGTIYDDSEQCSHCGKYLSVEDAPRRKPTWIWVGLIFALLIAAKWAQLDVVVFSLFGW